MFVSQGNRRGTTVAQSADQFVMIMVAQAHCDILLPFCFHNQEVNTVQLWVYL